MQSAMQTALLMGLQKVQRLAMPKELL